jgi:hypothetical protein
MAALIAAVPTTTLVFKEEIHIRVNPAAPHCLLVEHLSIPREIIIRVAGHPCKVELGDSWGMDTGEKNIPGLGGLQRCISSPDKPGERYFIPSSFLVKIIEK